MSETGAGEGPSKQIDIKTAATPVKDFANSSLDVEHTLEGRRLASAIQDVLFGEGVQMAQYPSHSLRDGTERFVVVDGKEEGVQILLTANEREELNEQEKLQGNYFPNKLEVQCLNKNKREVALISFIEREDGWFVDAGIRPDVPDDHILAWNKSGGMGYHPIRHRPMTIEEITQLTEQLHAAHPNAEMTEKAMKRLESDWKVQRLDVPSPQLLPPPIKETKAIES